MEHKTTKSRVLEILCSSGFEYVSGESIASQLDISRNSVWKAIKALKKDGYLIDSKTNGGYRLNEKNDILNKDSVFSYMKNKINVFYYDSIDSTNNEAKRLLEKIEGSFLVIANEQSAGRGRQGKSFYSPKNTGIYMSFVTRPNKPLSSAVSSTTAAAVAVCRAIEALCDKKPQIKWVNDVYLENKKICGILTEAVSDFETGNVSSVIIGIGLNVSTKKFPDGLDNAASLDADVKRAELIAKISDELDRVNNKSYDDFISYYRTHSMIIGKEINYIQNGVQTKATALEIDSTGGLVIKNESGDVKTLRSGEITVREAKGE